MKRVLKWIGTGLVAVAVLALIIGFVLYSKASGALERTYEVSGVIESVPDDSATLARGEHLATTLVCRDCHGDDLSGRVMIDAPPFLVAPSNLTSGEGGVGGKLSVADFDRAIRYGVKPTGRPLFPMMPSNYYHKLSDEDAAALIAYLKSLPPVDNVVPQSQLRLLGNMIVGAGGIDFAHVVSTEPYGAVTPPLDSSADYGRYFSNVICSACHAHD